MKQLLLDLSTIKRLSDSIRQRYGIKIDDDFQKMSWQIEKASEKLGRDAKLLVDSFLNGSLSFEDEVKFVDYFTVNETYFFRDQEQFEVLTNRILPLALKNFAYVTIWSAGCSIGCEPYSIAILVLEEFAQYIDRISIVATDISPSALEIALRGLYTQREVRLVPQYLLKKYFYLSSDYYVLSEAVKSMVSFRLSNLLDYSQVQCFKGVNIVFCRNVLIYFDEKEREKAVENIYKVLTSPGFLFLGSSEFIAHPPGLFKSIRINGHLVYAKVSNGLASLLGGDLNE